MGEHKEELERLGNATDYRCNDGGRTNLLPILSHSTRPLNELAPWAGFTATGWVKLFGLPAIAAAFYYTAKPQRRAGLKR